MSKLDILKFNCRLDPTRFKDGLRTLIETKASNEQIDKFMKMVQIHDVSEIYYNLYCCVSSNISTNLLDIDVHMLHLITRFMIKSHCSTYLPYSATVVSAIPF